MSALKKYTSGLTASTVMLALSSLFADISTEMLYPILPVFLTQQLGMSASLVGVVEGVAQGAQNVVQGFAGWLSDRLRRRKAIAITGYFLAAICKPLIGLSTSWAAVLGARSLERLSTGLRSAPRDALVAASVGEGDRGKAFGLEGFGDNLGAFLGPLVAVALLDVFHVGLRSMFLLSLVPGALAALAVLFVREGRAERSRSPESHRRIRLPKDYWKTVCAVSLFNLGNSSNSFLILRTKQLGVSLTTTIFVYASFNLVAALASYPAGHVSDAIGRKTMLLLSIFVFVIVYGGFAAMTNVVGIGALFALYGVHQGIFRSVGKALATDFVPEGSRATAIGWYTTSIGLTALVASVVGGQLWTRLGAAATFYYGAGAALVGAAAVGALVPAGRSSDQPS